MTVPLSTYRLQLHPAFTFDDAAAIVDYLDALNISHVYASPILQATPGSSHGYDVVDPTTVNHDLGGIDGLMRLGGHLDERGLGLVVDIVPNHMATKLPENRWFWDVLEHGRASRFAGHFDVDWNPPEAYLRDQVLLPILGDHYGEALEAGEIALHHEAGAFEVRYFEHTVPIAPDSLADLVAAAARSVGSEDLAFVARSLRRLPPATSTEGRLRRERHQDVTVLHHQLRRLIADEPSVGAALDAEVARLNADPDALDALLEDQNYRLAFWRAGRHDLVYRRFFDIDSLIGLQVEDPDVFVDVHRLILEGVAEGVIDGLRIDHPDGLREPAAYLRRLRDSVPDAWIVVEKILESHEHLRSSWPVDGTTGYDFLAVVGGLFVDPGGEKPFTDLYDEVTGEPVRWDETVHEAKHHVLREVLAADLTRLTHVFMEVCEGRRRYRDYTRPELREALAEMLACLAVYRTYVTDQGEATDEDRAEIDAAIAEATGRRSDLDPALFALLGGILRGDPDLAGRAEVQLRMRFQQLSGAVMAKSAEDTAFYRYVRLVGLNEVGGDPGRFGVAPEEFHEHNRRIQAEWPSTMLTLSTHDTKRSEDVRARLATLSEMPEHWGAAVRRWMEHNVRHHPRRGVPDPATEYLLYQTLVGAHPLSADRAVAYLRKATKEAKVYTSWTDPDEDFDAAVERFVEDVIADESFMADLATFTEPVTRAGRVISLAQKLLQLTAPGVPDVYQGTELWDLSLVDPDNRRPVDFEWRRALLDELRSGHLGPAEILDRAAEGLPKLWIVHRALQVRRRLPAAFGARSRYRPLTFTGPAANHAVGFVRSGEVAVVVPRLALGLEAGGGWRSTAVRLPQRGIWTNELTGDVVSGRTPLGELLGAFPVALLTREPE